MSARRGACGALAIRHIVGCGLLLAAVCAAAGEKEMGWGWKSERILIVGIPSHEVLDWAGFLERKEIDYRYDRRTHTMYVRQDPLPILEEAGREREIAQTVRRGTLERKLEAQLRGEFPNAGDPRVCLAFPTEALLPVEDDSEPVAMVLVGNLTPAEKEQARLLVADEVEGLPARNVMVMSGSWRPWPAYGGQTPVRTPKKSVAVSQTARADR